MPGMSRRDRRSSADIWPGFVDALAALLMVIIFLVMIFALSQFFLTEQLTGQKSNISQLESRVSELSKLLDLEREANEKARENISRLESLYRSTLATNEDLTRQLSSVSSELAASKEELSEQQKKVTDLTQQIAALEALRDKLRAEVESKGKALEAEKEISTEAQAQLALFNKQLAELRAQLAQLNAALEAAEARNQEQKAQIKSLGQRLNAALATKVQELQKYRSEFFGRLRDVLGNQPGIEIVGDRFVFQSEVLFPSGSDALQPGGKRQISQLAQTLKTIMGKIPKDIDWILRVDGHTDRRPISTPEFPSNWELSQARALAVVRHLISLGIPPDRLAATGFAQYQPIARGSSPEALRQNRRIELKFTQR